MKITFDPAKSARNAEKRDLPFERAAEFNFYTSQSRRDERHDYGEERWVETGYIGSRLHVICYVVIDRGIRVISLRKANARERKRYEENEETMDE
jgi:uncharacterized protein